MASEHMEIEQKFDVPEGFTMPDLAGVEGVTRVGEPGEQLLEAGYHDTADLRLLRARVTLRRRTGGADDGWHVKLPASAGARRELHSPLGRAVKAPPKAVLDPVLGLVRQAPTALVATLSTRRLVTPLLGPEGQVLAEVADDHVTGTALPTAPGEAAVVTTWREVEVELVDGDEELLAAVAAELIVSGARPSSSGSKVARVLADRLAVLDGAGGADEAGDATPGPDASGGTDPGGGSTGKGTKGTKGNKGKKGKHGTKGAGARTPTAGEVVVAAVAEQLTALQRADLMVRTGEPDGVHQVRVASRRLRSILAAHRSVLAREQTDPVRDELQWLGSELSGTRDAEVSLAHLAELVAAQPADLVRGPVAERLQRASAHTGDADPGVATLRQARHLQLLDRLFELVAEPPLTGRAAEPAGPVLTDVVAHTVKRLRRAVRAAEDAQDDTAHDLALHDVRKAAKRVRYTGDVAAPLLGARVSALVSAMKAVQEVLGDRQDTVVTREDCLRLGTEAATAGEDAWTWGRLHALEQARSEAAERDFWELWPTLRPVLKGAAGKH